jgi:putative transposase
MDERVKFVAQYLRGELSLTRLCESFGISRKTAYKWLERYADNGVEGLAEHSRKPHSNPRAISEEVVSIIVEARKRHPFWGPKKLLVSLPASYPGLQLPATSTVGEILARHGLVRPRRAPRRTSSPYSEPFLGYDRPNAVWCADFKGHFQVGNGKQCHPLTISDGHSRYLLRCEALRKAQEQPSRAVFESAFREFGLPDAIRTDNGPPFSSLAPGGLSNLAVWWIRLGIRPERIEPGRPDQNGRHERMHRTLKAETATPPRATLKAQQLAFDTFRKEYNQDRPHEALGQRTPASIYAPSTRAYPATLPALEYPAGMEVRYVSDGGGLRWHGTLWYISWCLSGQPIGIQEVDEKKWLVHFGPIRVGLLDQSKGKGSRNVTARIRSMPSEYYPSSQQGRTNAL